MKKLFVSLLLFASFFIAHSQLTQKTWLAGGTGTFYSYHNDYSTSGYSNEAKYTQIDFSASVGYFVADKLALGLRPTFSSIKGEVTTTGGMYTNVQRYWIGPFARYYFLNPEKQYNNIVTDISYQTGFLGGGLAKGKLQTFSALAGPVFFFNSSVGLEVLVGYSYRKQDEEAIKDIRKGFQTSVGFQIHLENE